MKVYYIGGSPCCGKTTIAEQIATEYGMIHFQVDDSLWDYANRGMEKGYPACQKQWKENWLSDIHKLYHQELQFYREIFSFIQEDIRKFSSGKDILVEGTALLPEQIKAYGIAKECYICLTPEKEFQIEHYRKREWVPLMLEGCSDKEKAFENWMERDVLFACEVRRQCEEYGYCSILVDGEKGISEIKEMVCEWFGLNGDEKCSMPAK